MRRGPLTTMLTATLVSIVVVGTPPPTEAANDAPAPGDSGPSVAAPPAPPPVVHETEIVEEMAGAVIRFRDAQTGEVVGETLAAAAPEAPESPVVVAAAPDEAAGDELPTPDVTRPDSSYDTNGDGYVDYASPEGMCVRTDVATARYHDVADSPSCI